MTEPRDPQPLDDGEITALILFGRTHPEEYVAGDRTLTLDRLALTLDAARSTDGLRADVREVAWLIERGQSMNHVPTVWWTGNDWTTDAWKAARYASRDEAEALIDARSGFRIPSHGDRFGVAVEHGFTALASPKPAPLDEERLARVLWALGYEGFTPVLRDDVKEPTSEQHRAARAIATVFAAYAEGADE